MAARTSPSERRSAAAANTRAVASSAVAGSAAAPSAAAYTKSTRASLTVLTLRACACPAIVRKAEPGGMWRESTFRMMSRAPGAGA